MEQKKVYGYMRVSTKEQKEVCGAWVEKKLTLKQAAEQCGLAESTFYDRAREWKKGGNMWKTG